MADLLLQETLLASCSTHGREISADIIHFSSLPKAYMPLLCQIRTHTTGQKRGLEWCQIPNIRDVMVEV